jgi:heavy metal sensor kinase
MFLKHLSRLRAKLAFRLTLWYALTFTISSCIAFLFFYLFITSVLRNQIDRDLTKQAGVFSTLLSQGGINAVKSVAIVETKASGEKKIFFRLLYPTGEAFSSSNMSYWEDIGIGKEAIRALLRGEDRVFDTIDIPERNQNVRILYTVIGPSILLQLGQSMEITSRFVEAFRKIFTAVLVVLILFSGAIGWFMARRAVSGLANVTRTARQISEGTLDQRVPVKPRGDEIDQLATTFNQMLDRIQQLVTGIKEMSDNIAHDLKSPITRIRGIAEVTLTTGGTLDDFHNMGASIIEECDRLLDMINTMLVISKTEAGVDNLEPELMDIARVVKEACELFSPMAEDKNIRLICNTQENLPVKGDIRLIQRMIANILDNSIKYTDMAGKVEVLAALNHQRQIVVTVKDTGIGISQQDLPHIFERFYRGDQSRSQGGTGLGLSLARTIARAHGGDISVTSQPGKGSTFTITIAESFLNITKL